MMPTPVGPRPVSAGPLPAMPVRAELSRQSWRMSAEPDVAQPGSQTGAIIRPVAAHEGRPISKTKTAVTITYSG